MHNGGFCIGAILEYRFGMGDGGDLPQKAVGTDCAQGFAKSPKAKRVAEKEE